LGALFMVIGIAGVGAATTGLQADYRPADIRDVRIERVVPVWVRSIHGANLFIAGETRFLPWRCTSDCSPRAAILAMRPGPAKLSMIGNHLVGIEANGGPLLDVDAARADLKKTDMVMWAVFAAVTLGAAIYVPWRSRALPRQTPGDTVLVSG